MVLITGELIKNSVVAELMAQFPNITVYKEAITNPVYPHFFVNQVALIGSEERKNRYDLSYSMNVRYHSASDPSTDLRLEQNLDAVSLKFMEGFNIISIGNELIRCVDKETEKEDGVLHLNFNINLQARKYDTTEPIKQNELVIDIKEKESIKEEVKDTRMGSLNFKI